VTAACATLDAVTDHGRSSFPDSPARHSGAGAVQPTLTADDLADATGGRLLRRSDRPIRHAAVDSRLVAPGCLFVALEGERTDGHRFLGDAVASGAAALLIEREPEAGETAIADLGDVTVVLVQDALRGLHAVAAAWRRRFSPVVVGITGSIAKTSTKEAVAGVFERRFATLRTEGNQNNEVGLPLTVLRLGPEHEAAVLEMGMYTGGEIRELAAIGLPRIGIVTAVQPVHLSRIGTIEAIVDACYPYGSIQVPGGTEPIVLHRDAVSGGGYFMLGTVISADMDLIGQLQPHTPARFVAVDMPGALAARHVRQALLDRLRSSLSEGSRP
jgi:hypothetical protein